MVLLPKILLLLLLQILTILSSMLLHKGNCTPNTSIKSVLCNSGTYSKGDPFTISLEYVVSELENLTPEQEGYDFHNVSPYPNAFAYGHAACNQNLTRSDCGSCLGAAKIALFATCQSRIGARSVLYDCTVRYEQYPFDD